MRQRIDDRVKKPSPIPLEKSFKEIVVGTGRAQEPYIIAFHYASDNVAGHGLGTLFGFFEVEIHDQDAAYIVNFLASVAKKEYFANPRRTPTDSFDAALHKINVALAEIVKHGNVSWLGHLHGAIGAVSGNTLHFSATGEGELYLAREENFQSISQGLADIGSEPHPLKTFTEVSSGELFDGDLVIAFSPSIWSLFSPEDLMRSLNRLGPAGFEQFLRTALINELPVAAAAILTCSAPAEAPEPLPVKKEAKKPAVNLENVWSGKTFSEALESKSSIASITTKSTVTEKSEKEEYTDKKTGHIYVQASSEQSFEAPSSRLQESWGVFTHHLDLRLRSTHVELKRTTRRIMKESGFLLSGLQSHLAQLQRSGGRRIRLGKRVLVSKWQELKAKRTSKLDSVSIAAPTPTITAKSEEITEYPIRLPKPTVSVIQISSFKTKAREIHLRVRSSGSASWSMLREKSSFLVRKIGAILWPALSRISSGFFNLTLKSRVIISGIALILLVGSIYLLFRPEEEKVVTEDTAVSPEPITNIVDSSDVFPPSNEPLSIRLDGNQALSPISNSPSLALLNINNTPFLVTKNRILNLKTQEATTTPEPIRLATGMDDLDSIFTITETGNLYLYSTITKKFDANTLPIPTGASIDAIGVYLTYLYVLDQNKGLIYRFPRAEGGFSDPVTWSKETLSLKANSPMSVYENIALTGNDGHPLLYTKGKKDETSFVGTETDFTADALTFNTLNGDVFALDKNAKRVVRWSATGTLINQYFHESFSDTEAIGISSDGTELFTSSEGATSTWRL